jgi:hypothetical protein
VTRRRTQQAWRRAAAGSALAALVAIAIAGPARASGPMADAMWGHWNGPNGLDTTSTANVVKGQLVGYTAYSTNPIDARAAMGTSYAAGDAIWWMAGHGYVGYITSYNATNGSTVIWTSGSVGGSNCAATHSTCLTNYSSTQMHDIRLMVFHACQAGAAISNGDSLPKRAYNSLGVDSSIGFTQDVGFSNWTSDYWAGQLTYYGMVLHYNVHDAAWMAANDVYTANGGNYNGYDSLVIYGGSVKIYPPAFGS